MNHRDCRVPVFNQRKAGMETITPSDRVIQIRIPSQLPIVIKGNHIKADFSK